MKQTAVEWLFDQMINQMGIRIKNTTIGVELFEQAKEMEKQQIIDAYGVKVNHSIEQGTTVYTRTFGEQYYNETFQKE